MAVLKVPFQIDYSGAVSRVTSFETMINQQILDFLVTSPFERTVISNYGAGVAGMLFENEDSLQMAEWRTAVVTSLGQAVLGVRILDLVISTPTQTQQDPETGSTIQVSVFYTVPSQGNDIQTFSTLVPRLITEETLL